MSLANRLRNLTDRAADVSLEHTDPYKILNMDKQSMFQRDLESGDLYIIRKGEANLFGKKELQDKHLMTLEKNDVFGYVPFLQTGQEPHNAVVMGSKDLEVSKLDTDILLKEYGRLSGTFRNLIENAGDCVSATTRRLCE